jgi:hypothetical protein
MHKTGLTLASLAGLSLLLADAAAAAPPAAAPPAAAPPAPARPAASPADPVVKQALAHVARAVIQPMAARDKRHSRFSRAPSPPQERQARIPDATVRKDAAGAAFVAFTVDARYRGDRWAHDAMDGCVYLDRTSVV